MVTNIAVVKNSESSVSRTRVARDRVVDASTTAVTGIVLAVTLAMFTATPLHANLSTRADSTLPSYSMP
jgi:hypothetical protein